MIFFLMKGSDILIMAYGIPRESTAETTNATNSDLIRYGNS